MNEASLFMTVTIETGNKVEEELAKDDLIVRSHNTHSCTGRPAVNSPATHGPV